MIEMGIYLTESAPGRIRTCDTRFRRAVLYPLSYEGMCCHPGAYRSVRPRQPPPGATEVVARVGDPKPGLMGFPAALVDQSRHLVVSGFETVNNSR